MRGIAYNNTDCFLICFSLVDRNSLENACNFWTNEVKAIWRECPCVLVGTKRDLRDEYEASEEQSKMDKIVTQKEMRDAARKYNFAASVECSAKQMKGIQDVFHYALRSICQFRAMKDAQ